MTREADRERRTARRLADDTRRAQQREQRTKQTEAIPDGADLPMKEAK